VARSCVLWCCLKHFRHYLFSSRRTVRLPDFWHVWGCPHFSGSSGRVRRAASAARACPERSRRARLNVARHVVPGPGVSWGSVPPGTADRITRTCWRRPRLHGIDRKVEQGSTRTRGLKDPNPTRKTSVRWATRPVAPQGRLNVARHVVPGPGVSWGSVPPGTADRITRTCWRRLRLHGKTGQG